jgi:3-methylfumaryl-CoA hydratase
MDDGHAFEDYVGRERVTEDTVTLERAHKLSATLDLDPDELQSGTPLPLGWHWIYFHDPTPRSALAEDGHERRGDFLPPIPLNRRMWAGGRLRFTGSLEIGATIRRTSTVRSITLKEGRSGPLAFVTVEHLLSDSSGVVLEEEQDIVYLNRAPSHPAPAPAGRPKVVGPSAPEDRVDWREPVTLDEVTLFRFSALTFNAHRIHYDRRYAAEVEHYPDIVVHGPLIALLLLGAGSRWAEARLGRPPRPGSVRFSYRALQPIFCDESIDLCGLAADGEDSRSAIELWAAHGERGTAMRADLTLGV